MKTKVFVTGSTGYLGKDLVKQLVHEGYEVIGLTRQNALIDSESVRYVTGDITQPLAVPEGIKVIFHCAGVIDKESNVLIKTNINGTQNIVDAALKQKCLLIYVSSAGVVGHTQEKKIGEDTSCSPTNLYEQTKFEAEKIVLRAVESGLKARIIRPTIIFGIGRIPEKDSFLHLIQAIRKKRYVNIGDGIYNLIHVEEVIKAMLVLTEDRLPNGSIYLLNTPISFRQFARLIRKLAFGLDNDAPCIPYWPAYLVTALLSGYSTVSGKKAPLSYSRLNALVDTRVFSSERILNETSYTPEKSITEWITATYELYREIKQL